MGIPTPYSRKEWEKATISDMLKNTHYIGKIPWGKYKTVKTKDPKTGKVEKHRVKVNPEEVKQFEGKHEAIISDEQFAKAQGRFRKRLPVNLDAKIVNPLAGIMHCASCGKSMQWYNPKNGLTIRYHHRESAICTKKSLPAQDVLDAIVEALKLYINDFEIKMQNDNNATDRIRHMEMIAAMEAELAKQERKRKKLFDDYEDDVYTRAEFIERKQIYAETIENLKKQITQAKENVPEDVDYKGKIICIHDMIEMINNPEIDAKAKNDFLRKYIEDIEYDAIDFGAGKGGKPVIDVILK
jgi:site-specific DNA recombinase